MVQNTDIAFERANNFKDGEINPFVNPVLAKAGFQVFAFQKIEREPIILSSTLKIIFGHGFLGHFLQVTPDFREMRETARRKVFSLLSACLYK